MERDALSCGLTKLGFHAPLTGWVREDGDALSGRLGRRRRRRVRALGTPQGLSGPPAPLARHRVVVHDVDVNVRESLLAARGHLRPLHRRRRDGPVRTPRSSATACGARTGSAVRLVRRSSVDWLSLNQGIAYSVQQGVSAFGLTFLDLSSYYDGWLSRAGTWASSTVAAGLPHGTRRGAALRAQQQQPPGTQLPGRLLRGRTPALQPPVPDRPDVRPFTSGSACLVTMTHTVRRGWSSTTPSSGRVIITLSDGRRYEAPAPRDGRSHGSELGVDGFEDRLIGFLLKPLNRRARVCSWGGRAPDRRPSP